MIKFFELLWETISNVVNLVKAIFQGDFSEAFSIFKDLAINALELLTIAILGFPTNASVQSSPEADLSSR